MLLALAARQRSAWDPAWPIFWGAAVNHRAAVAAIAAAAAAFLCGGKAGRVALGRLDLGARAAHWVGIVGRWLGAARLCRWPGYAARARPPRAAVGGGRGARTSRATWGPVRCAVGGEVRGNLFCLGAPENENKAGNNNVLTVGRAAHHLSSSRQVQSADNCVRTCLAI